MDSYSIQAASVMSGVSVHQIRAWEKRYRAVEPKRLNNNFRSYSGEDIKRLKILSQLSMKGLAVSKLAGHDTAELEQELATLSKIETTLPAEITPFDAQEKLNLLLKFLMLKRYDLISHEVVKLENPASVSGVLIPLMKFLITNPATLDEPDSKELLKLLMDETHRISITIR